MGRCTEIIERYKKLLEEDVASTSSATEELPDNAQLAYERIVQRVQSKSIAKQLAFWKNFSDKLTALFMEKAPSAGPKYVKMLQEIRKEFADMFDAE